ncbi:cytochrome c oxidase subunit CcoM [Pseudomonas sp. NPDC090201]
MFLDHAVLAGVITVMLMLSFFAALALFIWRDSHTRGKD